MGQQFQEYPKAMHHPQKRPAVLSGRHKDPVTGKLVMDPPGQPAKFNDVFVNNKDQEIQYASLGYVPNGVSDPTAYQSAITGNDANTRGKFVEYPKMLYRAKPDDPEGELETKTVATATEEKTLGDKWHPNPDAARAAAAPPPKPPKPEKKAAVKRQPPAKATVVAAPAPAAKPKAVAPQPPKKAAPKRKSAPATAPGPAAPG